MVHRSPGQASCRVLRPGANVFSSFLFKNTENHYIIDALAYKSTQSDYNPTCFLPTLNFKGTYGLCLNPIQNL